MQKFIPIISVVTDEVSPRLEDGIAFACQEGLTTVDVRSIGGVNFLSLDPAEQEAAALQIRHAGLEVGCLATPILKWPAPGQPVENAGDQFGFDRRGRTDDDIYRDAFAAAALLGTRNLRIFTLLTYDGFTVQDLEPELQKLLRLAESHDVTLHVENEPVCNVMSVADLTQLMRAWSHPRLRGLLDIGNAWWVGKPPSERGPGDGHALCQPAAHQGLQRRGRASRGVGRGLHSLRPKSAHLPRRGRRAATYPDHRDACSLQPGGRHAQVSGRAARATATNRRRRALTPVDRRGAGPRRP